MTDLNQQVDNAIGANVSNQATKIYNDIMNGNIQNYNNIVEYVQKILKLIPELDPATNNELKNYSQKQLESIINSFIRKVQKLQINSIKKTDNFDNKQSFNKIDYEKWKEGIKEYYENQKNNIQDIGQVLKIDQNPRTTYDKIYRALNALDCYDDFIYNPKRHCFEYIKLPNKSYTGCKKLNSHLFKAIIAKKTKNCPIIVKHKQLDDSDIKFEQKLHPLVKDTPEYKYILSLFSKLQLDKRYKRINRYMGKDILTQQRPSVSQISNKIFKRFKTLSKNNIDDNSTNKYRKLNLVENELLESAQPGNLDLFNNIKNQYNNVKVLDKRDKIQEKYREKQQAKQSDKLMNQLIYVPEAVDNIKQDLYKSSTIYKNPIKKYNDFLKALQQSTNQQYINK